MAGSSLLQGLPDGVSALLAQLVQGVKFTKYAHDGFAASPSAGEARGHVRQTCFNGETLFLQKIRQDLHGFHFFIGKLREVMDRVIGGCQFVLSLFYTFPDKRKFIHVVHFLLCLVTITLFSFCCIPAKKARLFPAASCAKMPGALPTVPYSETASFSHFSGGRRPPPACRPHR